MSDDPIEKRFAILCGIVRAQHFAWREAVCQSCRVAFNQIVAAIVAGK